MGQGLEDSGRRRSGAFVDAEQQLQAQSNACMPSQGEDANVARHDWWPQEVLHRRGAVRVSKKHLKRKRSESSRDHLIQNDVKQVKLTQYVAI